jgi:hypothetical protein
MVRKGVCPPEFIGADETSFRAVVAELAAKNVVYKLTDNQL